MVSASVGMVLAGGLSTRFDGDKSVALLRGRPLMDHVLDRLAPCGQTIANVRPGSAAERLCAARGLAVVHDPPGAPDGPLAGIAAGLDWALRHGFRWLVSLPCDVPLAPPDIAARLLAAAGDRSCAIARSGDDLHPLCAAWSTALLPRLRIALSDGAHPPIRRFMVEAGCGFAEVEAALLVNVNRRADLTRAEDLPDPGRSD